MTRGGEQKQDGRNSPSVGLEKRGSTRRIESSAAKARERSDLQARRGKKKAEVEKGRREEEERERSDGRRNEACQFRREDSGPGDLTRTEDRTEDGTEDREQTVQQDNNGLGRELSRKRQ